MSPTVHCREKEHFVDSDNREIHHKSFERVTQMYLHLLEDTAGLAKQPPRVAALLDSRACRSAVMFGDELLPERCSTLIRQLAVSTDRERHIDDLLCRFTFLFCWAQGCGHGLWQLVLHPSMVWRKWQMCALQATRHFDICAHGRPTLAPLIDLDVFGSLYPDSS